MICISNATSKTALQFKRLHSSTTLTRNFTSGVCTLSWNELDNVDRSKETVLSFIGSTPGANPISVNFTFSDAICVMIPNASGAQEFQLFGAVVAN